jgi:Mrp family chromosome partitioning ATPase
VNTSAGSGVAVQASPVTSKPLTAQPSPSDSHQHPAPGWTSALSNKEARETLQTAASLKLPQPLGLPSAFEALAGEAQNQLEAETFSPDWEVDRFAWPEICESLLQLESGYFHHVGERLKTATENGRHVLMITGSRQGEGRTTLALCLARCAAEAGVKVALVDADLKNPQLGTRLGMDTPCSWLEVIVGKAPLKETAVASIDDRLTLFPLASSEYVDMPDKRLISLLQRISRHYPLVIVDVGPLEAEDYHPFADADTCPVDAAIVVRDMRHTTAQKTAATAERLQESGIQAVGIAENFKPT